MSPAASSITSADQETCIAQFEAAWLESMAPPLAQFLPDPTAPHYLATLLELVCIDLELSWSHGRPVYAEAYLTSFPELAAQGAARAQLAEQEFLSRREAGENITADAVGERLQVSLPRTADRPRRDATIARSHAPRIPWRERVEQLYAEHVGGEQSSASVGLCVERWVEEIPAHLAPGQSLAGFRLVRELGRGSFGRVFLAEQPGLANRSVVLKIGRHLYDESQHLAQLLHTHIVPIYSVHRVGEWQVICMPFLGETTLADVLRRHQLPLREPRSHEAHRPTQPAFLGSTVPLPLPDFASSEPRATEEGLIATSLRASTVIEQAAQWNVADRLRCMAALAAGLAHAHERGIVHRDLKPANVLLADDGSPLLLDFNLALHAGARHAERSLVGGTLPYMAPEQLECLGQPQPLYDPRSDVYSLGVIFFELLTGRRPWGIPFGSQSQQIKALREAQRQLPELQVVLPGCSPAVAAMVRRCLAFDPAARYASAEQLRIDLELHLQDRPLRYTREPSLLERTRKFVRRQPRLVGSLVASALLLTLVLVGCLAIMQRQRAWRAEGVVLRENFLREASEARMLLSLPFPASSEVQAGRDLCNRALARYGVTPGVTWSPPPSVRVLAAAEQDQVERTLGELLCLAARGEALATPSNVDDPTELQRLTRSQALAWLREFEPSSFQGTASLDLLLPDLLPGELATSGKIHEAAQLLDEATQEQPGNAALWAQLGACHAALGHPREAVAAYTTCIALRPTLWRAYFWRAQAWLELKEFVAAERDLSRLLTEQPHNVPARVFRALAYLGLRQLPAAEADLTHALAAEPKHTRLYFMRSRVRSQRGDAAGAQDDLQTGLKLPPGDEISFIARGVARLAKDPPSALADFEAALKLNPWSREGAQNKAHVLSEIQGNHAAAVATLDPIVARYPDFAPARMGRAVLLARLRQYELATAEANEVLRRNREPLFQYQAACVFALQARDFPTAKAEALRLLALAVAGGWDRAMAPRDPDFSALRGDPEFIRITAPGGVNVLNEKNPQVHGGS